VSLSQQANVAPLLPEEAIQFLLPAADTVGIPTATRKASVHVICLGHAAISAYKEDDFEHSP